MWALGEALLQTVGVVESLYVLFKDSKEILLVLEGTSYRIGKRDVPAMEYFLNLLPGRNLDTSTKCKILKLIEAFIIVNHKEKITGHETILFQALSSSKLDSVMLPIKSNEHDDMLIYVPQKQGF